MTMKSFFGAALQSAIDLGIAKADDLVRHVTPDILAQHLPRPLWARLLTACVGAPKVDAQLVVETIGVSNLCEHVPANVIWACIAEIAARSLGGALPAAMPVVATPVKGPVPLVTSRAAGPITGTESTQISDIPATPRAPAKPLSIGSPPPPEDRPSAPSKPVAVGPSIPAPGQGAAVAVGLEDVVAELEAEDRAAAPARARTPTGQRFRQTNTNIGRLAAANQRRPQAQAAALRAPRWRGRCGIRRGETELEVEIDDVGTQNDWRATLAVEDEQLVDWSSSEETMTSTSSEDHGRKR